MRCFVCIMYEEGEPARAITVRAGYAVCDDHFGYVMDGQQERLIRNIFESQQEFENRRADNGDPS